MFEGDPFVLLERNQTHEAILSFPEGHLVVVLGGCLLLVGLFLHNQLFWLDFVELFEVDVG